MAAEAAFVLRSCGLVYFIVVLLCCSNFRMSKVPITEPTAWELYMQVPTNLQDLDRHRV